MKKLATAAHAKEMHGQALSHKEMHKQFDHANVDHHLENQTKESPNKESLHTSKIAEMNELEKQIALE